MFKILLALLLMTSSAFAVTNQWRGGQGTQELDGTQPANLIGFNSYNHIVQPLDNLLATYSNQYISYGSNSSLVIPAGSVMVSNSGGTIRLMLLNTAPTTVTWANIDTGSQAANTTYYVYAVAASTSATSATYYISASNTGPSGQTYYYKLGSFLTDASVNINPGNIFNNPPYGGAQIGSVNNYGSNTGSFSNITGSIKISFGTTTTLTPGATFTVTNLPYSSSSSYVCQATPSDSNTSNGGNTSCVQNSASSVTITNNENVNHQINWTTIGN